MPIDLFGPGLVDQSGNQTNAVTTRPTETRAFGLLDTWFRDCTSAAAQDGTTIGSSFFNGLLDEFRTLARGNGVKLDGVTPVLADANAGPQLLMAIQFLLQRGQPSIALDTGAPGAITIALNPAPPELIDGMQIAFKAAATNPGPATMTLGGATYPVVLAQQVALSGGEILGGEWHNVRVTIRNGTTYMRLVGARPRVPNLFAATQSGTYNPTPGARLLFGLKLGAGGGGAGTSDMGAAAGGCSGAAALFALSLSGVTSIPFVIGAGGAGGAATASLAALGGTGGDSVFGSYFTAGGGGSQKGGGGSTYRGTCSASGGVVTPGALAGQLLALIPIPGGSGDTSTVPTGDTTGSSGAASILGAGGAGGWNNPYSNACAGQDAVVPGSGGGGAAAALNAAATGGAGGNGILIGIEVF